MGELRIYALGSVRIEYRGDPVKIDTRKGVALLVYDPH